ncbi:peptidoglycan-binding protein [Streptomyces sp. NPDC090022]|uniref:peptidoglycan-binding domain-containing protein n=1 Tax=Streptomyces sp. NPDC090022 TaxID=3365920 RepID=UPI00380B3233
MLALLTAGAPALLMGLLLMLEDPEDPPGRSGPPRSVPVLALPPRAGSAPAPGTPAVTPSQPSSAAGSAGATGAAATPSASGGAGARPPKESAAPGTAAPPSAGTLRRGDRGPQVRALQERLFGQGFTYVSATGVYDEQTERGVAQLQRDRSLTGDPSGVYGPHTRAAFGDG